MSYNDYNDSIITNYSTYSANSSEQDSLQDIYKLRSELSNTHKLNITCFKISPNGKLFATASSDKLIKIYSIATNSVLLDFAGHFSGISDIDFSPCSNYLASASDDYTVRIWSLKYRRVIRILLGHTYHVTCVKFNYKGNLLISGSDDEAIRIWDCISGKCLKTLSAHSDPISSLDFVWDGTIIASSSYDGLIRLYDTESGQCLKTLMNDRLDISTCPVSFVTFSPNGKFILSSTLDGKIRLWDYMNNKIIKTYQAYIPPNETIDEDNQLMRQKRYIPIARKYTCSTQFITATSEPLIISGSECGKIFIWDLQSRKIKSILDTKQDSPVLQVHLYDNGTVMGCVTLNGHIQIWDLNEIYEFNDNENGILNGISNGTINGNINGNGNYNDFLEVDSEINGIDGMGNILETDASDTEQEK